MPQTSSLEYIRGYMYLNTVNQWIYLFREALKKLFLEHGQIFLHLHTLAKVGTNIFGSLCNYAPLPPALIV